MQECAYPTKRQRAAELGPGAVFKTPDGYWCERTLRCIDAFAERVNGRGETERYFVGRKELLFDRFLVPFGPYGLPEGNRGRFAHALDGCEVSVFTGPSAAAIFFSRMREKIGALDPCEAGPRFLEAAE